jgi:hypothetical protein
MKNLLQIGSGIFIFLIAASVYNLVEVVMYDFLLILKINHYIIFWLTQLISLLFFFISFIFLLKWFDKKMKSNFDKKILLQLFISYILLQSVQFFYTMYLTEYLMKIFGANYKVLYYETISQSSFYLIFNSLFIYSTHISIFIYYYLKIKKNTDL